MKRIKQVSAESEFTKVKVTVEIKSTPGWRNRSQMKRLADGLASETMVMLADSSHLKVQLSTLKVK